MLINDYYQRFKIETTRVSLWDAEYRITLKDEFSELTSHSKFEYDSVHYVDDRFNLKGFVITLDVKDKDIETRQNIIEVPGAFGVEFIPFKGLKITITKPMFYDKDMNIDDLNFSSEIFYKDWDDIFPNNNIKLDKIKKLYEEIFDNLYNYKGEDIL